MNPNYAQLTADTIQERMRDMIVPYLADVGDPVKDRQGHRSEMMSGNYRAVAVGQFVVFRNPEKFVENMNESAKLLAPLYKRAERGEHIAGSYLSLLNYQRIWDAFSACNFSVGQEIAKLMGGNDPDRKISHPFDISFGNLTKAVVLDDKSEIERWLPEFHRCCSKGLSGFLPYAEILRALVDQDENLANQKFDDLIEGHRRLCKGNRVLALTVDNELCVWGIGLANFCRLKGMRIDARPPLIPEELLLKS